MHLDMSLRSCAFRSVTSVELRFSTWLPCRICFLGDRLLAQKRIWNETTEQVECHTRPGGPIYRMYCGNVTEEDRRLGSDPDCSYMMTHNATLTPGIPGINLELFKGLHRVVARMKDRKEESNNKHLIESTY